jgi:tRNA-binding EMAP/Myf-like protein
LSDWCPQIVKIVNVRKHEGADALAIVTTSVGDYPIITKLGEYNIGDLAVYVPIDTIVPDTEQFHFLSPLQYEAREDSEGTVTRQAIGRKYEVGNVPENYRIIKAKRLRGEYSQGMLIPIDWDKHIVSDTGSAEEYNFIVRGYQNDPDFVGMPVDNLYGFFKWEEIEEEASDAAGKGNKKKSYAQNDKKPEGWSIPYYDIDSIRKFITELQDGEEVVLTEKIHGANAGYSHDGDNLWVKSRNYYKRGEYEIPIRNPETGEVIGTQVVQSTDQWWVAARAIGLEKKLAKYPGLVFFGECYGQVKGFRYDAQIVNGELVPRLRFFDIWDTKTMRYLDYDDRLTILLELGLDPVPELYRGVWTSREEMYKYAEGKTTLGGKHVREGFVLNTIKERYSEKMKSRVQIKLVGEGYNLQK